MFSLELCDRAGNLGRLLGTTCLWWFKTGTLDMLADIAYKLRAGVYCTTGAKGPILLVGSTLTVLPSLGLKLGGGGRWTATGLGGGQAKD